MKSFYLIPLKYFTEREEDTSVLQQEVERGVVWAWTQIQKPGRLEQDYLSLTDTDMLPNGREREGEAPGAVASVASVSSALVRTLVPELGELEGCCQQWFQGTEDPPRSEDSDLRDNRGTRRLPGLSCSQWATLGSFTILQDGAGKGNDKWMRMAAKKPHWWKLRCFIWFHWSIINLICLASPSPSKSAHVETQLKRFVT